MIVVAILILAGVVHWSARQLLAEVKAAREEAARTRAVALLQLFAPGVGASASDPRALLVWQPLGRTARQMYPTEFAALDRAAGGTFPFTKDQLQTAHADWTADWLVWERAHDAEYKLKAAALEHELGTTNTVSAPPLARARFDAIEREKLDLYQRRYQEYVRVAKALQALTV
ncbi:MAG: hypothetical protein AUJ01_16285 [Acidobacteria bacterium 13_1_40CM_3_65_5]|nr:MAG: hypothetical protein AUJ01_16285 [Acidobacteria bacterium 13_1_40CM_3_65_5]